MNQASLNVASRRLFRRNGGGAAALSGAAVVLLASREALVRVPFNATRGVPRIVQIANLGSRRSLWTLRSPTASST